MDGIQLVRHIKDDARLKAIPVVIVSYKDREEDRIRGLDAGANSYLTKSSFHDQTFLTTVADLIGEPQRMNHRTEILPMTEFSVLISWRMPNGPTLFSSRRGAILPAATWRRCDGASAISSGSSMGSFRSCAERQPGIPPTGAPPSF